MARFKLKKGKTDKDLGKAIFQLAKAGGGKGGKAERASCETGLTDLIDPSFASSVRIVYDKSKTIHIVVPYLGEGEYPDNDFADESMGCVVLRGCGM